MQISPVLAKTGNDIRNDLAPVTKPGWKKVTSVKQLWKQYPDQIRILINALNLNKPGLEKVKTYIQQGDTVKACSALIRYYKTEDSGSWLRKQKVEVPQSRYMKAANLLLDDSVTLASTIAKIPHTNDGGWWWNYIGPEKDKEFGYSLNSHRYLLDLLNAWLTTKQSKYAAFFDLRIRDWTLHNPLPAKGDSVYKVLNTSTSTLDWRDIRDVRWRDLQVGGRFQTWPKLFYGFQNAESFTPAGRLLMLSRIPKQANYLVKYHKKGHNWTTVEMDGLALTGLAFPEFKQADHWSSYAMEVMEKEINRQVYPDGVQVELSTMTHIKSLEHFQAVADHFKDAGRAVPSGYRNRLEQMYNYVAYSMKPTGYQPLNNDSDRLNVRSLVLEAARRYHRPDWQWIATNGQEGQKPAGLPSKVFPWAGINIMRSGWGKDAQWAFFDNGPFGTGHQHSDMLHLSIAAYGKNLLVDAGRYTHKNYFSFDPKTWRGYFRSSFSHNVILVDGQGQNPGPGKAQKPLEEGINYLNTSNYDYARGTFKSGFTGVRGQVKHTRSVLYLRDKYWIVVDRIDTDRPRKLEVLWHYAPDCEIEKKNKIVRSTNESEGNIEIIPTGPVSWKVNIVKGQTKPVIQGWYGAVYGTKKPSAAAVYSASIDQSATFAWVLAPSKGASPDIKATVVHQNNKSVEIKLMENNKESITVTIPFKGDGHPAIK